ncbi:MAG: error-prone DNA polymerase [Acidiphilium sp. 37-64-53]|uniref:error-prone DNA polymerase n=1 Tax=Acidiphilium TaxID=522 RepID=UPI000BD9F045|nr:MULTISPECIES: error-prone DNA polymerase [Acidiphilium]OYW02396.1 MAG: error-prone DNA polymerase [Acidiphilium sp. 37-64-53]OZB30200.1 MAG: error-prone DNA polymerase [Acidiphilium sp. 34-64-41]HQT84540.1 error-prone DNA polymerase [Acidiphilium rubrum]
MLYAELAATSAFSFLEGASSPEELVDQAKALGLTAIGIADRNSVAGVVRAHRAAQAADLRLLVGARLCFADAPDIICYPEHRAAWGRLCRLLSLGKSRAKKGECRLFAADLAGNAAGQRLILMPPDRLDDEFADHCHRLAADFSGRIHLAARRRYAPDDAAHLAALARLAAAARIGLIAVNDVLHHAPHRRPLQDVLRCIRLGCTIEQAGTRLEPHGERHLKPAAEMIRLFRGHAAAIAAQAEVLDAVRFTLDELRYEYPDEPIPPGVTPDAHLAALAWAGAAARYPAGIPDKIRATIARELVLIAQLDYARYFLTVHDIVAYARSQGILCQGRGSAANSAVCYALAITAVDPAEIDLLFERFVSAERREPPDIDVDFEHERREEVIQYIYRRYGRENAAIAATVIHYRPRSAIREVGKVLGLPEPALAALAAQSWNPGDELWPDERVIEAGLDPAAAKVRRTIELARDLVDLPRHLSQHVGGFILTRDRLDETVPIGPAGMPGRSFIEWDKDDIDALGMMKVDILALGMLTCIRKCFAMLGIPGLADVPREDARVYDMLCTGDSIGVFQVESRAQMNMLPRLKPRAFYDLVIEVAIVRPGPIQGDMVHPYLRRRQGLEDHELPAPHPQHGHPDELRRVLGRTLGVPLFQEQAMRIAIEAAKFTPGEANALRRAMATFRNIGTIHKFQAQMVEGMVARGYQRDFAERCFKQIEGFGTYGFPESHAASFAHLVYVSAWLKCHHPAEFAAALLNSQPMGFYAPAQIVRDARAHGVAVRAADINASDWDCTIERGALRLGLRLIDGFHADWAQQIIAGRGAGYATPADLQRLPRPALDKLADAGALRSLGFDRRTALWRVGVMEDQALPLFANAQHSSVTPALPAMSAGEHVTADYRITGLSLRAHPMALLRHKPALADARPCADTATAADHSRIDLAGVVVVRQRPGSAKGTVFITIEDETGIANLIVWPAHVLTYRAVIIGAALIRARGRVQRSAEGVVHVVVESLDDLSALIGTLDLPRARADEIPPPEPARHATAEARPGQLLHARPGQLLHARPGHPRHERIIRKSRDFH